MPWLSVFLPPPTHIYIHSRFLARCSSPCPIQQGDPICPRSLFLPPWPAVRGILKIPSPRTGKNPFLSFRFSSLLPFIYSTFPLPPSIAIFHERFSAFGRALVQKRFEWWGPIWRWKGDGEEEEVVFNAYVLRPIVAAGYRPLLIILREFRHDHPPRTGGGKKHPVYSVRKKDSFPLPLPLIRV